MNGWNFGWQTDKLSDTQKQMDNATQSNLLSLVETTKALLQSTAQTRNKLGQFVDDTRWTTYQAGIIQYEISPLLHPWIGWLHI